MSSPDLADYGTVSPRGLEPTFADALPAARTAWSRSGAGRMGDANAVAGSGVTAYVGCGAAFLVVDVGNPTRPVAQGAVTLPPECRHPAVCVA